MNAAVAVAAFRLRGACQVEVARCLPGGRPAHDVVPDGVRRHNQRADDVFFAAGESADASHGPRRRRRRPQRRFGPVRACRFTFGFRLSGRPLGVGSAARLLTIIRTLTAIIRTLTATLGQLPAHSRGGHQRTLGPTPTTPLSSLCRSEATCARKRLQRCTRRHFPAGCRSTCAGLSTDLP